MTPRWNVTIADTESGETETLDDEQLMCLAQKHPDAFRAVFDRYAQEMERYFLSRLGGDPEAAEDLTSQVFLRAWTALPTYRQGSLRGWLYQIARNLLIDHLRRLRPEAPLEAAADAWTHEHATEDQIVADEARMQLHDALGHLSESQRAIILLRLQGLTGREIASRLGMSHDAVRSAQYRAMANLRRSLAHLQLGDDL